MSLYVSCISYRTGPIDPCTVLVKSIEIYCVFSTGESVKHNRLSLRISFKCPNSMEQSVSCGANICSARYSPNQKYLDMEAGNYVISSVFLCTLLLGTPVYSFMLSQPTSKCYDFS